MQYTKSSLLLASLLGAALSAQAGVVLSSSAPAVDVYDIAQLTTGSAGNSGLSNATYIDTATFPGSTFVTPGIANLVLDAVSVHFDDNGNIGPFSIPNLEFTIGVVTGGTTFTPVSTQIVGWDGTNSIGGNKWATLTLNTTVSLSSNTTYAFGVRNIGNGYGSLSTAGSDLLAGAAPVRINGASLDLGNAGSDLAFHLNVIPEPSTYAAIAGALALGLVAYRRRR